MKVLIFGSTGMVGQGVLRECLLDNHITEVVSIVRSASGQQDSKLTEIVLPDLTEIATAEAQLSGFDACFFCLGVSSVGMSEADYTRTTYDLTMKVANVLAPLNPQMTFIYVSGASTSRDSRQMWARVKARTEDALTDLPFKSVHLFRPGFIQPLHGVVSKTRWYMAVYAVSRLFSSMLTRRFPSIATTTERLGRAMINVGTSGYPKQILESVDINIASTGSHASPPFSIQR